MQFNMKKWVCIGGLILLMAGMISCSKNDNGTNPEESNGNNSTMTAVINGQNWDAESVTGNYQNNTLTVMGVSTNDGISITITKFNVTAPGTYAIPGDPLALANVSVVIGTAGYNADSGTLEITQLTATEVQGTFTATVVNQSDPNDTRDVTNGSFSAKF